MRSLPVSLLLGLVVLAGACSQVDQAVDQAADRADRVVETARYCAQAIEVAHAVADGDVDATVEGGGELVEVAPTGIEDDARLLLDAAERAQDGELGALQSEEVTAAAQRLRDATERECSPGDG